MLMAMKFLIRGLPEDVHEAIGRRADTAGISMNRWIVALLTKAVRALDEADARAAEAAPYRTEADA